MKRHLTIFFSMLLTLTMSTVRADTTVKILHIQDNPKFLKVWKDIGAEFEKQNPGVKIDWQFLENEAFKAKLPTTLQSNERPDLFYSWAGGVFFDQARAGVLRDITSFMEGEWSDTLSPAGVQAFSRDGKVYGAPMKTQVEILWFNKALLKKAGVDPASLSTWEGFIEAVKKCKAAGITPLATGGGDKWPLHFYWNMLALRIGGKAAFKAAYNKTEGQGFDSPTFVKAGEMFKELIDLDPFQPGFLSAKYQDAAGYFGDGKAAMFFMGDFLYPGQKQASTSGKGIPDDQLDLAAFPAVEGGKGNEDVLGAVEGWLVAKGAPDEAVNFLRFFLNKENQTKMAAAGIHIPLTLGAEAGLENPFFRRVAEALNKAPYLQIVYNQILGANAGRVVDDVSADLAAGTATPQQAAKTVEEAWQAEK